MTIGACERAPAWRCIAGPLMDSSNSVIILSFLHPHTIRFNNDKSNPVFLEWWP
jgi:hypothetical protein